MSGTALKGKTYVEIHGLEKALRLKQERSKCLKGRIRTKRIQKLCECGCNETFTCLETSQKRFIVNHRQKHQVKIPREIRLCKCGCGKSKQVKVNSKWQYIWGHNGRCQSLETRKKRSLSSLNRPGYWRGKKRSIEYRERLSIIMKDVAKNRAPEHIRKFIRSGRLGPNKNEQRGLLYLDAIFPNKFRYCGDGSFMVGKSSPDAVSEELKTIVLFHGVYWHLKRLGLEISEENKYMIEQVDQIPFRQLGWKVIILWEDDLKNKLVTFVTPQTPR